MATPESQRNAPHPLISASAIKRLDRELYYIKQIKKYLGQGTNIDEPIIGDDSVLIKADGKYITVTTDSTIESIHFTPDAPIYGIIHKSVKRSVTDTLAFGAEPKYLLMNLIFNKKATRKYINRVAKSTAKICRYYKIELVGGDTSFHNGNLILITTIIGELIKKRPIFRSKCNIGDYIYVTGRIGGSLIKKHYDEPVNIQEIKNMIKTNNISSMIDITDGFISDLAKLTVDNNKSALIMEEALPIMDNCRLKSALYEGEDYEFIMTSRQTNIKTKSLKVTRIGKVTKGKDILIQRKNGRKERVLIKGWSYK